MMKGILFDFNGTMIFDGALHREAWDVFSKKYRGKGFSDEEMANSHGRTNKQIIKMLMNGLFSDTECEQLSKDKEKLYRESCLKHPEIFQLVPGLEHFLDQLKANKIPMTICSASIQANIRFFIDSFHLERWFDCDKIVYDDGTHYDKVSMFRKGAELICVPIANCTVFEDSLSGITFAHQCGVKQIIAISDKEHMVEYNKNIVIYKNITNYENIDFTHLIQNM